MCLFPLSLIVIFLSARPITALLLRRSSEKRSSPARHPVKGKQSDWMQSEKVLLSIAMSPPLSDNLSKSWPRAKASVTCLGQDVAGRGHGIGPPSGVRTQKKASFFKMS